MNAPTAGFIGKAVLRREDQRFLTGNGQYTDDIVHQGQTYAVFVRSPHAHAKLLKVDTEAARAAPGVVGIFTGDDFVNVGGLPCGWLITSVDGTPMKEPKHPLLAHGKVRHVGDQVAVVIAETLAQAKAAASLVHVDYEVLPAYSIRLAKSAACQCTMRHPIIFATPGHLAIRLRSTQPSQVRPM